MFTSFSTALSALNATSTAVDVVGNNLANLNTPGFKTSVVYFRDLVTQSLGAGLGETQVGFGTGQPLTIRQFTQGAIQSSTGLLDAAIQGDGFFVVKNAQNNTLYTRAGNFQVDDAGDLLTNTGEKVQGWTAIDPNTGQLDTTGAIGDIVVPVGGVKQPVATRSFSLDFNLDSSADVGAASDYSETIKVYDSLGTDHVLTIHFQKTDANTWSYSITMPGEEVRGGTAGQPFTLTDSNAAGSLQFDSSGNLATPAPGTDISFQLPDLADGAAGPMQLTWKPFTDSGGNRITQYGQPSAPEASSQDGSAAAQMTRVGLGNGGQLLAQYSDGQQVVVGQVAMANVRNPESLIAAGNNNFQVSARTATPAVGLPNTGGRGDIVGGSIEASTVDIAREFTNLIVLQRGYQANSRVVTTVDQLSQETINLIH
ncbi:MAG TPA: flagellar hook protein FlgE [Candidatus Acidoferrales bacterium]|nr:flagellar hook protein FlgE [Candidatus Acidoferrales bacterium]